MELTKLVIDFVLNALTFEAHDLLYMNLCIAKKMINNLPTYEAEDALKVLFTKEEKTDAE